jgi:phosphoglucosamine mutase
MGRLFGTDGIRGIANVFPVDVQTAVAAGKAIAHYFKKHKSNAGHVVIGQDTRRSGDMLAHAIGAGACAAGADAWMLGVSPTPAVAYLVKSTGAMAGIVISASHNPFEDNGIKVFDGEGYKLTDAIENELEMLIRQTDKIPAAGPREIGVVQKMPDGDEGYLTFLMQSVKSPSLNQLCIVVDCANGATYRTAPQLLARLGADVFALHCAPDGFNINDKCGSQHPEAMARMVVSRKADIGLAFDGDGDRLIAVDEAGQVLSGDQIMAICAQDMLQKGALKGNKVVSTVMSNMGFKMALESMGIDLRTTQVGDRYVMEAMRREEAVLGGEDSGHMIFGDVHTTGDGLMAALRLLEAMRNAHKPLSELSKVMTVLPQKMINVDVQSKPDIQSVPQIMKAIARAEESLKGRGRVLVRYSGTQNKCRVMVEGPTLEQTHQICTQLAEVIRNTLGANASGSWPSPG